MYEFLAKRYALALYDLGEEKNKVEEYINEFREISALVTGNDEIQQILNHPKISTAKKKDIFSDLFSGKISVDLLSLLFLLIEKDRIVDISEILRQLELIQLQKNNTVEALVKTVVPLLEAEKNTLVQNLKNKYHKKIVLIEEIDRSVIGGVYLRVGDDVIDGTVKNKLQSLQKVLLKDKLEVIEE